MVNFLIIGLINQLIDLFTWYLRWVFVADSLDIFTGILLTVIGLVLVYGSIVYRLIDLILIIGVLITIFGLYKLLPAFILRILDSRSLNRNSRRNRLNQKSKNDTFSRGFS